MDLSTGQRSQAYGTRCQKLASRQQNRGIGMTVTKSRSQSNQKPMEHTEEACQIEATENFG